MVSNFSQAKPNKFRIIWGQIVLDYLKHRSINATSLLPKVSEKFSSTELKHFISVGRFVDEGTQFDIEIKIGETVLSFGSR